MRKLLIALVAALLITAGLLTPQAANAGSTNNSAHNAGGWASITLDFNTTKINAGTFRLNYASVCMSPGDVNTDSLKAGGNIAVRGSGGALIVNLYVPRVGRNACVSIVPNPTGITMGSGATGRHTGTVNIDPWIPYPDYDFNYCRGVVVSGGC